MKSKRKPACKSTPSDSLTAERIRATFSDPKTPAATRRKLKKLVDEFFVESNAFMEETPDLFAEQFLNAAAAHKATPRPETRELYPQIIALAEKAEPEEYRVARRVRELFAADSDALSCTAGGHLVMEAADSVMESAGECVMLSSPLSEFFIPFFVKAAREVGRDDERYTDLKKIIARVDAGEDLDRVAGQEDTAS